ncbi:hypothetical protein [Bacillus sp. UNCCL13]|nr:hypothetical protein [Bacillus sp. UNCCL13]
MEQTTGLPQQFPSLTLATVTSITVQQKEALILLGSTPPLVE